MSNTGPIDLEDLVITAYCALDDALKHAGVVSDKGKLIPRRGPPPEVDDREVLCLCLLQEWLGFDSDLSFYEWCEHNQVMCDFFPRRLSRQNWADRRTLLTPLLERLAGAFAEMAGDDDEEEPPLFIVDSHPVDVCRPVRERKKVRLDGMAKKGYCSSLKRWFVGLREHLVFTPDGRIAFMLQLEGNRHDVQGLYAFLETAFRGCLLADNGYWPKQDKRIELEEHGITVIACTRSNQKYRHTQRNAALLKKHRPHVERFIGLFDQQFNATRTQCRNFKNYVARRWAKALAHNASRFINKENDWPTNSVAHLRKVS